MGVDVAKWIWHIFLIVVVVTSVFVYYLVSNKDIDTNSFEAGLLKERIKFSLVKYGDLSDCNIPRKYGVKLIIDGEKQFVNEESYLKDLCDYTHYCKDFKFNVDDKEVKLDVVFEGR